MTSSKSKIESRIGRLLQGFDQGLYYDYSRKTRLLHDECKKNCDNIQSVEYIEDEIVTGVKVPAWYIDFNEPVYITLSNPLSLFRNHSGRAAGEKGSEHFFFQLGLIPVYFATMNTMSMLKLYQGRAGKIFDPSSSFFEDIRCIELSHKKGYRTPNPVKFSSMNIIEQSTAKENLAGETISNWFYNQYFKFAFWLQPRPGFTPSTHMEFDNKMRAVFKLSKSVYTIDKLGQKEKIKVAGKEIEAYSAEIRGVWVDTLHFGSPFKAKIEASILEELTEKDPSEIPFINGILMEIRDTDTIKERKFVKILTVGAGYGSSYFDMVQMASGMLCYRMCRDNNTISKLGSANGFQNNVERICSDWTNELKKSGSFADKVDNIFQTAIDMMFPMLIIDKDSCYFTNPIVIGFLKKWELLVDSPKVQKSILLLLLPLLDTISSLPWSERRKMGRDEKYMELAKFVGNDPKFASSLIRLVKEISLSNLIRKTYQTEFEQNTNSNVRGRN